MLRFARIPAPALIPILLMTAHLAASGQSLMVGPTSVEFPVSYTHLRAHET